MFQQSRLQGLLGALSLSLKHPEHKIHHSPSSSCRIFFTYIFTSTLSRCLHDVLIRQRGNFKFGRIFSCSCVYKPCQFREIKNSDLRNRKVYTRSNLHKHIASVIQFIISNLTVFSVLGDWPNTYSFTKALAEDMVKEEAKGLPIAILRPSIGTYSTFTDYSYY